MHPPLYMHLWIQPTTCFSHGDVDELRDVLPNFTVVFVHVFKGDNGEADILLKDVATQTIMTLKM